MSANPFACSRKPFLSPPSSSLSHGSPRRPARSTPSSGSATGMPSAPEYDEFSPPPGYDIATSVPILVQPPPCYLPPSVDNSFLNPFHTPNISNNEAQSLLISHVASKCCWGSRAAQELIIDSITMKSSYHYHLDTYTEKREITWKYEPAISYDSWSRAYDQHAPRPFDVPVTPEHLFVDGSKKLEVPNTSIVRRCDDCLAMGAINCTSCFGQCTTVCVYCSGAGQRTGESIRCLQCSASGRIKCNTCSGTGKITCNKCNGSRNLRWYIELTVNWKNYEESSVSNATGLKPKHILKVKGIKTYQEESTILQPLTNFPDSNVANASIMLVERQLKAHPNERVIRQRHHVRVIPVALVNCTWKGKSKTFYIYGAPNERNVYFKKYPHRCCCGILCTIA